MKKDDFKHIGWFGDIKGDNSKFYLVNFADVKGNNFKHTGVMSVYMESFYFVSIKSDVLVARKTSSTKQSNSIVMANEVPSKHAKFLTFTSNLMIFTFKTCLLCFVYLFVLKRSNGAGRNFTTCKAGACFQKGA